MPGIFKGVTHIHDKAFRHALTSPCFCNSLFDMILPEHIKKELDLSAITLLRESFVDENLRKLISDGIFSIPFKEQDDAMVAIVEHQSTHNHSMIIRMEEYKQSIIKAALAERNNEELVFVPLIYAVVLYHGRGPYKAATSLEALVRYPVRWPRPEYNNSYEVFNLHEMDDDAFQQYDWAGALCFAFKHIRDKDGEESLRQLLMLLNDLTSQGSDGFAKFVLEYFCSVTDLSDPVIENVISQYQRSQSPEEKSMSTLDKIIAYGRREGIEIGRQEGRQEGRREMLEKLRQEGVDTKLLEKVIVS